MAHRIRIDDGLSVDTGQPTREELERLAQDGFKTVVNLRTAGEQNQPLSPEAEGEVARKAGLDYLHIPVVSTDPRPEQVDQFREKLSEYAGAGARPLRFREAVWCVRHSPSRQSARAVGEEALAKARMLGFDWKSPELRTRFVTRYLGAGPVIPRRMPCAASGPAKRTRPHTAVQVRSGLMTLPAYA